MAERGAAGSSGTHAQRLVGALAERGLEVFSTAEAREAAVSVGVPLGYVNWLLMLMVRNRQLVRLRRGLYARSGPSSGDIEAHPFLIATRLVTPSAISHWSALSHHGLTEQVPRVVTALTPKKVVTPSMHSGENKGRRRHAWEIAEVRYEYVTVNKRHFFGIEQVWVDENTRVPITDRERTVLETFVSPRMFGGIGEALGVIDNYIADLDAGRLIEYASRYGKISLAKRLGWTLERAGVPQSLLAPLLDMRAKGYHALDPTRPRRGPCDDRWMIQENLPRRSQ